MDKIKIKELEIYAYHGVFQEEKEQGQRFYVNIVLETDFRTAAREDRLEKSTHYGEVCEKIRETFTKETYDLIETAAFRTAEAVLQNFPGIQKICLEVRKPEAPIPMEFSSVSVELSLQWHKVYLSFGSNMGDKERYVKEALKKIEGAKEFRNLQVSDFYRSEAYGGIEQDDYLNGVLFVETYLEPYELLDYLHKIEREAGRERILRWGPRTLDLDILFYDDLVLDEKELQIPHKDMKNRDFVLLPLKQIAAWYRHPVSGKTVEEMAEELKENYLIFEQNN